MAFINGKYTAFNPEFHVESDALNDLLEGQWTGEDGTFICTVNNLTGTTIQNIYGIEKIQLPNCKKILGYTISYLNDLTEIIAPECEELGANVISNCDVLTKLSFPKLNTIAEDCFGGLTGNYFEEVTLFTENPFKLSMDEYDTLYQLSGVHLTVAIDTQDDDYEEALAKLQALNFDEILIYDENGELIEV